MSSIAGSFGWRISCRSSACGGSATLDVGGVELLAHENRSPVLAPQGDTNLWYQVGQWIRGTWPLTLTATDPSGICRIGTSLGDETLRGPASKRNRDSWQQCPERHWKTRIDTTHARGSSGSTEGPMALRIIASNAAGVGALPYRDDQRRQHSAMGKNRRTSRRAFDRWDSILEGEGRRKPLRHRGHLMSC